MSEQRDFEEQALEAAWNRCLEPEGAADPGVSGAAVDEALVREYTELLGLLPHALEPAVPSLSTKVRLLAVVGGDAAASGTMRRREAHRPGTSDPATDGRSVEELTFQTARPSVQEQPAWDGDVDASQDGLSAVDVTLHHGTVGESVDDLPATVSDLSARRAEVAAEVGGSSSARSRSTPWLAWGMAAMLAFCMLGLGYLAGEARQQQATIARLQADLQERAAAGDDLDIEGLLAELATSKRRLAMVTEVAQSAYPMRTVSTTPDAKSRPEGIIYVCGQHQQWYLNVKGLEPPSPGKEYHLWFMTDGGTIDGGTLDVEPGAQAVKEASSMPSGTHGFSITLEDVGPHEAPEGLMVLLGEQAVSL